MKRGPWRPPGRPQASWLCASADEQFHVSDKRQLERSHRVVERLPDGKARDHRLSTLEGKARSGVAASTSPPRLPHQLERDPSDARVRIRGIAFVVIESKHGQDWLRQEGQRRASRCEGLHDLVRSEQGVTRRNEREEIVDPK